MLDYYLHAAAHTHTKSMRANIHTDARHANGCAHRQIDLHTVHTVLHHTTIPKYHRIPHHAIEINSSCSLIDLIGDFCILFPCCFAEDHMQFLLSLPEGLVRELFHESRSLTLAYHPFFMEIGNVNRTMELNLCNQAVQELYLLEKLCWRKVHFHTLVLEINQQNNQGGQKYINISVTMQLL